MYLHKISLHPRFGRCLDPEDSSVTASVQLDKVEYQLTLAYAPHAVHNHNSTMPAVLRDIAEELGSQFFAQATKVGTGSKAL